MTTQSDQSLELLWIIITLATFVVSHLVVYVNRYYQLRKKRKNLKLMLSHEVGLNIQWLENILPEDKNQELKAEEIEICDNSLIIT